MAGEFFEFVNKLLDRRVRSTILYSLGWLIGLLSPAAIASYYFNNPPWVGATFTVLDVMAVVGYMVAYGYFAYTDPDRLHSERHLEYVQAIERGFIGDDMTGYRRIPRVHIPLPAPKQDDAPFPPEQEDSEDEEGKQ